MQLHELKRNTPNRKSKNIGRGGKRGKTSGKGHKGQNARTGTSKRPEMRDIIKKLPKLRGYAFKSFQERPVTFNLSILENNFASGENINPQILLEKGLLNKKGKNTPMVKILGTGEITKKLNVTGCQFSESAKVKIEKAGGKIE
ncbi:MAG: 50S ribosomal protein L15 [Patescibacteria group bacterium]